MTKKKPTKLPERHNVVPESEAAKIITCCWQYVSHWDCGVASNNMFSDEESSGCSKNKSPS